MNDSDYRYRPSPSTDVQLNKPRHSSSVPLRCANQSCSYYERNKDLDLDSQKFILSGHECFLILNLVGVICPFAAKKVDNLRVSF
jgi:hypothetical protein